MSEAHKTLATKLAENHYFHNGCQYTDYSKIEGLTVKASTTNGTSGIADYHGQKVYFCLEGCEFNVEPA